MATVARFPAALGVATSVALVTLAACDDLVGLDPIAPTPLASVHVRVTGTLPPGTEPAELKVAVVWLRSWLTDPSCLPPAENPQHAEVMASGCTDPLGVQPSGFFFVDGVVVADDRTATLDLFALPDQVFGDAYAQIAYASIMVSTTDGYVGASFSSMAGPDTRLAFRHGGFDDRLGYYPRRGCGAPPHGFSVLSAGGFTVEQAIEAQARGELPLEDPAGCHEDSLDHTIDVALQPAEELEGLTCFRPDQVYYTPPPETLGENEITACTSLRDRAAGRPSDRTQVLVTDMSSVKLCNLRHHVLRGCFSDPFCDVPEWDMPPPPWWPCPVEAAR
jgi:hypothetical protein